MEIQDQSTDQFSTYPVCSSININIFKGKSILYSVTLFQLPSKTSLYWLTQKVQSSSPQSIFYSEKKKKKEKSNKTRLSKSIPWLKYVQRWFSSSSWPLKKYWYMFPETLQVDVATWKQNVYYRTKGEGFRTPLFLLSSKENK